MSTNGQHATPELDRLQGEIGSMRVAYAALEPLDAGGRRRAIAWLAAALSVDADGIDVEAALRDAEAAGLLAPLD
ncbi:MULTISPECIES: hypothetical protein [Streptomyces]|uniref:hypothetical protein n=1 Tax=Streptomyces TaxID=1883 RepID=UPI0004CCAD6E|nr:MULTISPECIES: hypothetical protein [Streptomyces]KOT49932.1 hypothetical protein ADK43_35030 [Streptomyces rimosus subsp. rimosus]